jgi:FkbM family methyltransferase
MTIKNNYSVLEYNKNKSSAAITTAGHLMFYSAEDDYGNYISANSGKIHDEFLYDLFPLIVKKNDLAMDIGANYGYFTMQMAEIAGNEGAVVAVELNTKNADYMTKSFNVNYFNNINSLNIGISDNTYKSLLCKDPTHQSNNSLGTAECTSSDAKGNVLANNIIMSTVDAIMGEECREQLGFIRIDIEGNECKGILGATSIIENSSNLVISFEWQNYLVKRYSTPEEQKNCLNILYNNGYRIIKTDEYIKIHGMEFSRIENDYAVAYEDIVNSNMEDYVAITENAYNNRLDKDYYSNTTDDCLNRVLSLDEEYLFTKYALESNSSQEYSNEL